MTESCVVELAGIPIEIRVRHQENRDFLSDYFTDTKPVLHCTPSNEDLRNMERFCLFIKEQNEMYVPELTDTYIENVTIEAMLADLFIPYNILQFHGSAICLDGKVYIFTAPSGTGKSTHTKLWRETFGDRAYMINDDKPLIKVEDNRVLVYGSPWDGKHNLSRNTYAPLNAIVHLNRGKDNRIEKITAAEAFPVVFRQAHTSDDPDRLRKIMRLERRMLSMVRCYRLHCNMEPEAAVVAWRGMNEPG